MFAARIYLKRVSKNLQYMASLNFSETNSDHQLDEWWLMNDD
jgi:hypothetical protein